MNTPESRDLRQLIETAQITALPQSAIQLIQLSQDPANGPSEFAAPIEADPGLTVQVLRFVNSSYFGFRNEISSVKLAISLVGIRTIKNFALWSAVFSLLPNPKCGPFDLRRLWQDSLRRALCAGAEQVVAMGGIGRSVCSRPASGYGYSSAQQRPFRRAIAIFWKSVSKGDTGCHNSNANNSAGPMRKPGGFGPALGFAGQVCLMDRKSCGRSGFGGVRPN